MKIRNTFISNSSSTSFIIYYKDEELSTRCPTCGHSEANLLEIIRNTNDGDTEINWEDPENYLEELQKDIERRQKDINECNKRNSSHPYSKFWNITVGDFVKQAEEEIQQIQRTIQLVKDKVDEDYIFVGLSISNHSHISERLEELKDRGIINILESCEC